MLFFGCFHMLNRIAAMTKLVVLNLCSKILSLGLSMVKTVTISDAVYCKLKALKYEGESFSQLLNRLSQYQSSLQTLTRLRASVDFDFKEKEQILSNLR